MTEPAAVRACRIALMTAALWGDVDRMAELHRELDHLTCLRRLVPEQRSGDDVVTGEAAVGPVRDGAPQGARPTGSTAPAV